MKKGKVLLFSLTTIVSLLAAYIGVSFVAPINPFTPFGVILSKKGFQGEGDDILVGNSHLYFQSPFLAAVGTPAWNEKDMVYGLSRLEEFGCNGTKIHYELYSEDEREADDKKNQVGLYYLPGDSKEKKPFILNLAGGGFTSVCTFAESLPVAARYSEDGYPSFALTYRIGKTFGECESKDNLMEDISRAVSYIIDNADLFNVDPCSYMINGFSAGAIAASMWCDKTIGYEKYHLPAPKAAGLIYGFNEESVLKDNYVPSFVRFCKNDQFFELDEYQKMISNFEKISNPYDAKIVNCPHGFGLGSGSEAEGWVEESIDFLLNQLK